MVSLAQVNELVITSGLTSYQVSQCWNSSCISKHEHLGLAYCTMKSDELFLFLEKSIL